MTDVHQRSKVDFLFVSLSFQTNLLLALSPHPFARLESFRASSIPCPLLLSHPEFSSLEAKEYTRAPNCIGLSNCILCLRHDLHDLSDEMIPNVVSWTHEHPRYMHALSFYMLLDSSLFASVS